MAHGESISEQKYQRFITAFRQVGAGTVPPDKRFFVDVGNLLNVTAHTAKRAWLVGWPQKKLAAISELFPGSPEEILDYRTSGAQRLARQILDKDKAFTEALAQNRPPVSAPAHIGPPDFGAAADRESDPPPDATPTNPYTSDTIPPTTEEAQPAPAAPAPLVVLLDQREIDRRVARAVGIVKRDIAQALERENQMLKVVRSNAVGLAVSVERILVALQPLLDNMPEQIAMEVASGKMTALKTLEMLQRLAKAASTVTYVAGAAMQHQRLLAGMPQQITESRTGEADKPSEDMAEDMTTKLLTTLARAQFAAQGGDDNDGYSGEESGRPDDAIDVESEPTKPKP